MESQMTHAHGQGKTQEHEPHTVRHHTSSVAEGEDEQHHEKKSVLTKVKAKARKIKDSLTKHGHGQNHDQDQDQDQDHIPDVHDLDEEDDDEEEMAEDPEVHGAPIYEATAIKTTGLVDSGVNSGRSKVTEVDTRLPNVNPDEGIDVKNVDQGLKTAVGEIPSAPQNTPASHTAPGIHHPRDNDPTRTLVHGEEERSGQPKVNLQRPERWEEDLAVPKDTPGSYVPVNYQAKVGDHTGKGGEAAGVNPDLLSFDKMKIYDEPKPNSEEKQSLPTGTEDFFTSVPTGSHDQFSPELTPPERRSTEKYPQENIVDRPSNERDEFSPVLTPPQRTSTEDNPEGEVVDRPSNERDQFSPGLTPPQRMSTEDNPQENVVDRPSNQGSYIQKISSATSAITDRAVSAKNVVASKLGYGEKDNTGGHEVREGDKNSMSGSAVDYGKKMAATVTEKPTPVYEKVAGAGSTKRSKMQGATTGTGTGTGTGSTQERGVDGQDKGVSVKDYIAEKLRPGEEDKALSEVISETLHKKKVDQEKPAATSRPVSEVISDALHKRNEEPDETDRPMGKVTESEEVARRLDTHNKDSSKEKDMSSSFISNDSSTSGNGVVDKIKGAVGSWFGKGGESQGSQQSLGSSFDSANDGARQETGITEERRPQESGN
ncbi:low-temperature-induced 65 kDa protein [Pistacia vera]|uniref:low-temperature-induced 65 kDa protein n=1 Tax=Pistacia vera TaxID=55513 RepID=UPI0012631385|nr:low-temperature-induced 65 kDa protein [Pistacia vera]